MRVECNAGHGGGDMVVKRVQKLADTLAFLQWQLGGSDHSRGGAPGRWP